MAIKDPLMFITIEEFKNWKGFNNQLFDEITTPDSEIRYAIEIASNNIDFLSGFIISKKWPEINPTKFTDNIQTATTHYVNFLLSKGVEYARGQASIGQGGIVYSQNNPEDPYFIPTQVFNYLRDINKYPNMQGFPLNSSKKESFFDKFLSNRGEINKLIEYLKIINLTSSDNRVKINIYQLENLDSPIVDIDTRGINTTTTVPDFKSPKETIDIIYDKENHIVNVDISNKIEDRIFTQKFYKDVSEHIGDILNPNTAYKHVDYKYDLQFDKYTPNTLLPKKYADDKLQDKLKYVRENQWGAFEYIDFGTIPFTGDKDIPPVKYVHKFIDEKTSKKQDKLIAGANIHISDTNVISATGGNEPPNLDNYYTKPEVDEKLKNKVDSSQFKFAFMANALGTDNPDLLTTDKTIVGGMNELLDKKQDKENWTIIGKSISNREYGDFQLGFYKLYRTYITWEKPPFNQVTTKIKVEFKTGGFLGGYNDIFFLTIGKIENEEVTLSLKVINHNFSLIMTGGNAKYGNIFSLEELQNTVKVNIIKPFKINSKSLKTNEIEENNWDIELKENPTTHCPCPKWKDVAVSNDRINIQYKLKSNTFYRIFYDWEAPHNINMIGKYPTLIKEFFWTNSVVDNWEIYVAQNLARNTSIMVIQNTVTNKITLRYASDYYGNLWKLQELQE